MAHPLVARGSSVGPAMHCDLGLHCLNRQISHADQVIGCCCEGEDPSHLEDSTVPNLPQQPGNSRESKVTPFQRRGAESRVKLCGGPESRQSLTSLAPHSVNLGGLRATEQAEQGCHWLPGLPDADCQSELQCRHSHSLWVAAAARLRMAAYTLEKDKTPYHQFPY